MFDNERLKLRVRKPRPMAHAGKSAGVWIGEGIPGTNAPQRTESRVTPRRARDKVRIGIGRPSIPAVVWDKESESHFQARVIKLAHWLGWKLIYHTFDARRSPSGFPDLVLVHERQHRLMFVELKSQHGKLTQAQERWRTGLLIVGQTLGIEYHVWRPSDWTELGQVLRA